MQMDLKISFIKNKLKKYLKDKEVLDIIVFGSAIKGKAKPEDIDIAIITKKQLKIDVEGFHASLLTPEDFFVNPPSIVHTLLREGYSLKNEKPFSEIYKFSNKVLFKYELTNLSPSEKVKIVNILRGKRGERGFVRDNSGEWLANQVFIVSVDSEHIFSQIFINFGVKFSKFHVLIH